MKHPWMPLYAGDLTLDTTHLTAEEFGAYMRLIVHYWAKGGIPDDDQRLARIAGVSDMRWQCVRICVSTFFASNWTHARIDKELENAAKKCEKARAAASKRWKNKRKTKNANAYANGYANAMLSQPHIKEGNLLDSDPTINLEINTSGESRSKPKAKVKPIAEFQQFWNAYGHKVDRPRAERAFVKALQKATLDVILKGVARYRDGLSDLKYLKDPAAWLNGERWSDEPSIQVATTSDPIANQIAYWRAEGFAEELIADRAEMLRKSIRGRDH